MNLAVGCNYFLPGLWLPSQPKSITAPDDTKLYCLVTEAHGCKLACLRPRHTGARPGLKLTTCESEVWWFPVDFQDTFSRKFSRICSFIDIYQAGSLTTWITLTLFTQAIAQLKDIYQGLIAPTSINPGLLQDVSHSCIPSPRLLSRSLVKVKRHSKLCEGQPLCHSALRCCLVFNLKFGRSGTQ